MTFLDAPHRGPRGTPIPGVAVTSRAAQNTVSAWPPSLHRVAPGPGMRPAKGDPRRCARCCGVLPPSRPAAPFIARTALAANKTAALGGAGNPFSASHFCSHEYRSACNSLERISSRIAQKFLTRAAAGLQLSSSKVEPGVQVRFLPEIAGQPSPLSIEQGSRA